MTPVRDHQRQRCYDAESSAFGGTTMAVDLDWESVVALVATVTHHPWWRGLGAPPPRLARARTDARRSVADGVTIRIARDGQQALTVVHELAHHLTTRLGRPDPGHGAWFRSTELELVRLVAGDLPHCQLAEAFAHHGLQVERWDRPPSTATHRCDALVHAGPGRLLGAVPLPAATEPADTATGGGE